MSRSTLSMSTVYLALNICQVWRLVKHVSGIKPSRDAAKLGNLVKKIVAENSILQAQIKGL